MSMTAHASTGGAVSGLSQLAARLDRVAAGESATKAAGVIAEQLQAQATEVLGDHVRTGNAAGSLAVTPNASGVALSAPGYLKFHSWWPFARGLASAAPAAAQTLAQETAKTLAGQ